MKLMNLPHVLIVPYLTCNFACSYCCANQFDKDSLNTWNQISGDVIKFLNTLDKKMIVVSGGEPLIWQGWLKFFEETEHYYYFATNASVIPKFLETKIAKGKVKLFLAAFHRENSSVEKFIGNVKKLQDMGYAVFAKIVYTHDYDQVYDIRKIHDAGIPVSFTPLVGGKYSDQEVDMLLPYCDSNIFAERFLQTQKRKDGICPAGMKDASFEIRQTSIARCGLQDIPVLGNVVLPKFIKKLVHDGVTDMAIKVLQKVSGRKSAFLGNIYKPEFNAQPLVCHRERCDCEWHTFSEMGMNSDENARWQKLIDTGKWV